MSQSLPPKIFTIYQFFEKTKENNWSENPFIFYKIIRGVRVKIAENISNLNYYQIDFTINKKINPAFIIKYIRNIQYRNYFSPSIISFKEISSEKVASGKTVFFLKDSSTDVTSWLEEETYNGITNIYNCLLSNYQLLFYTNTDYLNINISDAKYYNCYKILNDSKCYILRFETVLNFLDIDQNIDIDIYIQMIINILSAIYTQFKLKFNDKK
jgi:hypothetical protein